MIARYDTPEMHSIWSDKNRYLIWLKIELEVCRELASKKVIPSKEWQNLKTGCEQLIKAGGVSPERVEEHEKKLRHDVIAFTTAVAEKVGPSSRFIHYGLTSSDVLDTALSIQIQEAGKILQQSFKKFVKTLEKRSKQFEALGTIGRSHGIYAEPTSFGLKFLSWHAEWSRNLERLDMALERMRTGKLSGAVGVNAHLDVMFEKSVLKRLGLKREAVSTQVIPRDHHAEFLSVLAVCGGSLERIAVELRHLQRSEVAEAWEGFQKGQKGSSAMPHKKNPISAENITGCARLLRSYAQAALENIALWHERDISHSSVERIVFPDATTLMHYAVERMNRVVDALVIEEEKVKANLDHAGTISYSGHMLLALVKAGASREDAYYWVQECAHSALKNGGDFLAHLKAHPKINSFVKAKEIDRLGSLDYQLRNVPKIFKENLSR